MSADRAGGVRYHRKAPGVKTGRFPKWLPGAQTSGVGKELPAVYAANGVCRFHTLQSLFYIDIVYTLLYVTAKQGSNTALQGRNSVCNL